MQGTHAYIGNGFNFQVLDVSQPSLPTIVGECEILGGIRSIFLRDTYAYAATGQGVTIVDISSPATPTIIGTLYIPGIDKIIVDDSLAYVTSFGRFSIVDISNPYEPLLRDDIDEYDFPVSIAETPGIVYVGNIEWPELHIFDVTNPDNISFYEALDVGGYVMSGITKDSLLFLGIRGSESVIKIFNISNPYFPIELGSVSIGTNYSSVVNSITLQDNIAYVATRDSGIYSIDISDANSPHIINHLLHTDYPIKNGNTISTNGNIVCAAYNSGVWIIDSSQPDSLQERSFFISGGDGTLNVALRDQYAYLAVGSAGLAILDISNPTKPVRVGAVSFGGTAISITLVGHYAFLGDQEDGFWIVDISNPQHPRKIKHFLTGVVSIDYALKDQYLYTSGIRVFDVHDPENPFQIGEIPSGMYQLAINDTLLYVAAKDRGLVTYRISNPYQPEQLSQILDYSWGLTNNDTIVYVVDSYGLKIVSLSNPEFPVILSSISISGSHSIVYHSVFFSYLYLSYGNLLVTVDISDPTHPTIVSQLSAFLGSDIIAEDGFIYMCNVDYGFSVFQNKLQTTTFIKTVNPGWNMVSLPFSIDFANKSSVFPTAVSNAFAFQENSYVATDVLQSGIGYWVKFDSSETVSLYGLNMVSDTMIVKKGWNIIGSVSSPVDVATIITEPSGIIVSPFFNFQNSYNSSTTLEPGKGYWVKTNQNGILIMSTIMR